MRPEIPALLFLAQEAGVELHLCLRILEKAIFALFVLRAGRESASWSFPRETLSEHSGDII